MLDLFIETLFNWITILFYFVYYYSFGLLFIEIIPTSKNIEWFSSYDKVPSVIIYGIFANITFLQLWNIFFPISKYCSFLLIVIALYKFIKSAVLQFQFSLEPILLNKYVLVIFFIFTFWIANLSNSTLGPSDTGLYHLQHIKWLQSYPLMKGLANLLFHLGYNSSLFLLVANFKNLLFSNYFLWNHSGFLLCLAFYYFLLIPFKQIINKNKKINSTELIMKLLFNIPLVHYCFYYHPSTSTDLIPFIFGIILAIEIFKNLFYQENNLLFIICIIFIGISSKLSFIVFGFTSFLVVLYVNRRLLFKEYFSSVPVYATIIILSFAVWIYRNTMLSGYPLFPYHKLNIPVEWKVEKKEVQTNANLIKDTASGIKGNVSKQERKSIRKTWILSRLFVQHRRVETLYPLIIGMAGFIYFLIGSNKRKIIILYLIPALSQMFIWFFYTPDPRFGCFAFWWFGGLFSIPLSEYYRKKISLYFPLFILIFAFSLHKVDAIGQVKPLLRTQPIKVVPQTELKKFKTRSGLEIWVPDSGYFCFDSPIPCSPDPDSSLRLITKGNIWNGLTKE